MTTNAEQAAVNFALWVKWHPGDFKGAAKFASDYLDCESDLDELIQILAREAGYDDDIWKSAHGLMP